MQRRSQTVRHHAKPSLALASDDLGVLREGDESNEDVLRRQLLDRDRECDKLRNQIQELQNQLSLRPPLEHIQAVEKEYKDLDLLLQGTQRENERCMAELEREKTRGKMLERELTRLAGENWQAVLDINPSAIAPSTAASTIGRSAFLHSRSNTLSSSPLSMTSPPLSSNQPQTNASNSSGSLQTSAEQQQQQQQQQAALAAHVEQVRMMILGMEKRLEAREGKLKKCIDNAESEGKRLEEVRQEILADA